MAVAVKKKSQPVLIAGAIIAGMQVITGGAALADVISPKVAGFLALLTAGAAVGLAYYVREQVTPTEDVQAYVNEQGHTVAGDASLYPTGDPVAVVPAEPSNVEPDPLF